MKVLVQMLYWYPYVGALQPIYGPLFEKLTAEGHSVSILTSFPHFRRGSEKNWREYRGRFVEKDDWHGVAVYRTWVWAPRWRSRLGGAVARLGNYASWHLSALWVGLFHVPRHDVVFAPTSPPVSGGFMASLLAGLRGMRFVYNIQDLYPEVMIGCGMIGAQSLSAQLIRGIEGRTYRHADRVVVINRMMAEALAQFRLPKGRVTIIPNYVDTTEIHPASRDTAYRREFGLRDTFVVLYSGNLGMSHDYETVLAAAESLQDDGRFTFLFAVRGEAVDSARKKAEECGLRNVRFVPLQPRPRVSELYATADVGLVTVKAGMQMSVVPSKTLSIMSSGRPVIGVMPDDNPMALVVRENEAGLVSRVGETAALVDHLRHLRDHPEEAQRMGENGRRAIEMKFTLDIVYRDFRDCLLGPASAE